MMKLQIPRQEAPTPPDPNQPDQTILSAYVVLAADGEWHVFIRYLHEAGMGIRVEATAALHNECCHIIKDEGVKLAVMRGDKPNITQLVH